MAETGLRLPSSFSNYVPQSGYTAADVLAKMKSLSYSQRGKLETQAALGYGLAGAWNPAALPEYPDAAAGTTYFFDNFQSGSIDSWAASGGTGAASGASGVLTLTNPTTGTYLTKNIAATTTTVKVRARQTSGTLGYLGINFVGGVGAVQSDKLLTADWQVFSFTVTGTSTALRIHTWAYATQASTLEIDWIYVGDGTYTTTLADLSGNGNAMTVSGCTPVDGTAGKTLYFDGANDEATVSGNFNGSFTLHLRSKIPAPGGLAQCLVGKDNVASLRTLFLYASATTGYLGLDFSSDGSTVTALASTTNIADNASHGVDVIFTASTSIILKVDGVTVATLATGVPATLFPSSELVRLGRRNSASHPRWLAGAISEFRIYNRALSDAEIWELYQNPGIGLGGPVTPKGISDALARQSPTVKTLTSTEKITVPGIQFPATQSADADPNTLDDYEEGTFTPTVTGSSTAGAPSGGSLYGKYTKVGNRVNFLLYTYWTSHTGSGNLLIGGLPFTSDSATYNMSPVDVYHSNYALTAGNTMQAFVGSAATAVSMRQVPTGGGAVADVPLDTSALVIIAGGYFV